MLTFKVDKDALVTYIQDGESFTDIWPWGNKAEAEAFAKAVCDKYNSKVENPDGIKYPKAIPTAEEKLQQTGFVLPK
jgi:hypothetical protein